MSKATVQVGRALRQRVEELVMAVGQANNTLKSKVKAVEKPVCYLAVHHLIINLHRYHPGGYVACIHHHIEGHIFRPNENCTRLESILSKKAGSLF